MILIKQYKNVKWASLDDHKLSIGQIRELFGHPSYDDMTHTLKRVGLDINDKNIPARKIEQAVREHSDFFDLCGYKDSERVLSDLYSFYNPVKVKHEESKEIAQPTTISLDEACKLIYKETNLVVKIMDLIYFGKEIYGEGFFIRPDHDIPQELVTEFIGAFRNKEDEDLDIWRFGHNLVFDGENVYLRVERDYYLDERNWPVPTSGNNVREEVYRMIKEELKIRRIKK